MHYLFWFHKLKRNQRTYAFDESLKWEYFQYVKLYLQINDLHDVLERLQNNQIPTLRKKHGYLPMVSFFNLISTFKISVNVHVVNTQIPPPSVTQESSVR